MIPFGQWNQKRRSHQEWTIKQRKGCRLIIFGVIYKHIPRRHQIQQKFIGVIQEFIADLNIERC